METRKNNVKKRCFKILITLIILVLPIVTLSTCAFGPSKFKGVLSYRHGRVFLTKQKTYSVGILPKGWERLDNKARAISFYNKDLRSSISTDAFCGEGVEAQKIYSLGGEMMTAVEKRNTLSETEFELDGRGALRRVVAGSLDGVPVIVDLVVVRKNGCVFDFYAVGEGEISNEVETEFEMFFGAFHFE